MLKLVDDNYTYEKVFKLEDETEDKCPVFVLRKLSANKKNTIDDQVTSSDGKTNSISFKGGTARRLKIDASLVSWRNVFDNAGEPVECTPENKGKLPVEVQEWLENEIDGTNKLSGMGETERKN